MPSTIIKKVLILVLLTSTVPEVYVATMTTILSYFYHYWGETPNHLKSLKLKFHPGENVADCCATILVYAERLESYILFKPDNLVYITSIFEDISDYILHIWADYKYKEVMEFIKKLCVFD